MFSMLHLEQDQYLQKEKEELEMLNKQLKTNKDHLQTMSLQAHMLQVDLVTQFNPFTVEKTKNAQDICEKCQVTIQEQEGK